MPYNRSYSLQEIERILSASERRPRPDRPPGAGELGHALSLHTDERKDFFSRPSVPAHKYPKKDSIFLGSRSSLVHAVHEIFNSTPGQIELAKLNHPNVDSVVMRETILRKDKGFDIFTVYRPKGQQSSFDWLSTHSGDGFIVQVFILVCKIPGSAHDEIHIQTAFPEDYARTMGDDILR